jgi:NAD(P)-dependent dehydrogenase (short-subunit alcohol dehydrogenase family)
MEALDLTEDMLPAVAEQFQIPMGRLGQEDDIAPAAVYLASDAAAWVTGEVLTVSGGL